MDDAEIAGVGTRLLRGGNPIHPLHRATASDDGAVGDGTDRGCSQEVNAGGGGELGWVLGQQRKGGKREGKKPEGTRDQHEQISAAGAGFSRRINNALCPTQGCAR